MEEIGKEALLKLIEFVESASPKMWEIALRQVQVHMIRYAILGGVMLAVSILILWGIRKLWYPPGDWGDDDFGSFMFLFACEAGSLVLLIVGVLGIASRVINPEYYAIKVLMKLFGVG